MLKSLAIQVMNLSSKIVCNKIHGRSQHRIVAFLMSLHVVERPVWLVRAGASPVPKSLSHYLEIEGLGSRV